MKMIIIIIIKRINEKQHLMFKSYSSFKYLSLVCFYVYPKNEQLTMF